MRTTLLAGLVVVLLLLSACGTSGAPGELVTEVDDVVGVWRRTKDYATGMGIIRNIHINLRADGTMGIGVSPDKWDYEWSSHDFAFEGTHFSITETAYRGWEQAAGQDESCTGSNAAPDAVYEIQQLANGNLKFATAQQDACTWRAQVLALAEWEPVP